MDSRRTDRASDLLLAAPMLPGVSRLAKAIGKLHCEIGSALGWDLSATRTPRLNPTYHIREDFTLAVLLRPNDAILSLRHVSLSRATRPASSKFEQWRRNW